MKKTKKTYSKDGSDKLLPKLSLAVFNRPRLTAIVWITMTVFGGISYTNLLQREGFPSINVPFSVIAGTYFVDDPSKVDSEVTKHIGDLALKDSRVKLVQSHAQSNFYDVIIQFKDGTDANQAGKELGEKIKASKLLPEQATYKVETPKIGFTERGDDSVVSLYAKEKGASTEALLVEGKNLAKYLKDKKIANVEDISVIDPFVEGKDFASGVSETKQIKFDRYGVRENGENKFYDSVSVGIQQKDGTDIIKLNDKVEAAVNQYNQERKDSPYSSVISGTFAKDIEFQIEELQKTLLEGLLAVLVIGSIVIAVRASLITIISMVTVLSITVGMLYLFGFTLNTITLFALILSLGLIVDDTIIMIEAIDAQRRKDKNAQNTVKVATRKVSRAMVAATSTAALSFAPLIFVGGVLGSFIRQIPITVITSLLVSLFVALFFIPLFARYILLGKKQMGAENIHEPAARLEAKVAQFVGKPMLWARDSRKKLFSVGIAAIFIGFTFIAAGGFLFSKVTFNIFPADKDSNQLMAQISFKPETTIKQAEAQADKIDSLVGKALDKEFKSASYYSIGNAQRATLNVYLTPYSERAITAPDLQKKIDKKLEGYSDAKVKVGSVGAGPPSSAFSIHIETGDRVAAQKLAKDMSTFLQGKELKRPSGKPAKIISTEVSDPGTFYRQAGESYTEVTADFDGTDTSTLVILGQDAVKKEFTPEKLATYGLKKNVINFNLGQEQENQDSFKTLAMAFPILLLVIYLLLSIQFRSLLQPLLIFMAIPFSLFGITLGLYLTDNAFSFFSMLGFFALIGLSIKNTILLTDYANQLRHAGESAVDAAVGAVGERFRPLIATSLTAVVSLIPLTLSSPFWQGLTVVLMFGLLSSTFLVITVFPYYYLGAEFIRLRVSRKACLLWLFLTIAFAIGLSKAGASPALIPLASLCVIALEVVYAKKRNRIKAR